MISRIENCHYCHVYLFFHAKKAAPKHAWNPTTSSIQIPRAISAMFWPVRQAWFWNQKVAGLHSGLENLTLISFRNIPQVYSKFILFLFLKALKNLSWTNLFGLKVQHLRRCGTALCRLQGLAPDGKEWPRFENVENSWKHVVVFFSASEVRKVVKGKTLSFWKSISLPSYLWDLGWIWNVDQKLEGRSKLKYNL